MKCLHFLICKVKIGTYLQRTVERITINRYEALRAVPGTQEELSNCLLSFFLGKTWQPEKSWQFLAGFYHLHFQSRLPTLSPNFGLCLSSSYYGRRSQPPCRAQGEVAAAGPPPPPAGNSPSVLKFYTLLTYLVPERMKPSPATHREYQPLFQQNGTKYFWSYSEIYCLKTVHLKCPVNRRNDGVE